MKKWIKNFLLLLFLIGTAGGSLYAQQDPIPSQVSYTASQGAGISNIGNLKSFATVGQQAVGVSGNEGLLNRVGFIYTLGNNCPKPFAVKAENIVNVSLDNNSADVSWSVTGFTSGFEVRFKPEGTLTWTTLSSTGPAIQLTGLLDGVNYQLQVRSSCGGNFFSGYSEVVTFTTTGPPSCPVPSGIAAESLSPSQQKITWVTTEAVTYDVRYRLKGTLIWTIVTGLTQPTTTLANLEPGMTYQYQIRGLCSVLQSVYSDVVEFTTQGLPSCELPSAVTASDILETTATILWAHPGAQGYSVRYRLKTSVIWTTAQVTASSISLTNLEPGMPYVVSVQAICNTQTNLRSPFTDPLEFSTKGLPSCEVPSGLTVAAQTTTASATWDVAEGAVLYDVRYRVEGTALWTTLQSTSNGIELPSLEPGTSYQLQARSVCNQQGSLISLFTPAISFTTNGLPSCDVPGQLSAAPEATSAVLSWASATGASKYEVRYRVEGTLIWKVVSTNATSLTITNLESGTPYLWTVRSICNETATLVSAYAENASFSTKGEISCEVPSSFIVSDITESTVKVAWTGPNASSYSFRYRLNGTAIWSSVVTTVAELSLQNLEPGLVYQYQVRSVCNADGSLQSLFSDIRTFETIGLVSCAVPSGLTAVNITTNSATPSWAVAEGATEYELRYRIKGTTVWTTTLTSSNQRTLTGLESGMTYQFSVRSNCKVTPLVTSVFSEIAEFTLLGLPSCDVPDGFAVSAADNDADISWNDKDAEKYELRYRVTGSTVWTTITVSTNSASIGGLFSLTEYQVQVRSVCATDGSLKSTYSEIETFKTTGTASCDVPEGISVTASSLSAAVVWGNATGALQYDVRYRVKGTTLWSQLTATTASANLTGLNSGMPYQIRIRSLCSADQSLVSAYSSIIEFSTTGSVSCAVPVNLQVPDAGTTSAALSWDAAFGASKYELQYRKQGDVLWSIVSVNVDPGNSTPISQSITGLVSGSSYQWKVRSICSADGSLLSVFSVVGTFQTKVEGTDPGGSRDENSVRPSVDEADGDVTADEEIGSVDMILFPNPADEQTTIRVRVLKNDHYSVVVQNLTGIQVGHLYDGGLSEGEERDFSMTTDELPAGLYLVRVIGRNGQEINKKLIIAH